MTRVLLILTALFCGCSAPEQLVPLPQVAAPERVATRFASIEVMEVSLPSYAASEEIAVADGPVLTVSDSFWADDPTRAITLALSRNLKEITGARVAPEPWPFDAFASARVDVRVERFLVENGALVLAGQYFVADLDGGGRDHAHLFALSEPVAGLSLDTIATARGHLIAALALEIAQEAL